MLDALGSWIAFIAAYTLGLTCGKTMLVSNGQVRHNIIDFCIKINLAWLMSS